MIKGFATDFGHCHRERARVSGNSNYNAPEMPVLCLQRLWFDTFPHGFGLL